MRIAYGHLRLVPEVPSAQELKEVILEDMLAEDSPTPAIGEEEHGTDEDEHPESTGVDQIMKDVSGTASHTEEAGLAITTTVSYFFATNATVDLQRHIEQTIAKGLSSDEDVEVRSNYQNVLNDIYNAIGDAQVSSR